MIKHLIMTLYEYIMLNHNTIDIFGIWSKMTSNVNMGPCPYFGLKWGSKWVKTCQSPYKSQYKCYFWGKCHMRGR